MGCNINTGIISLFGSRLDSITNGETDPLHSRCELVFIKARVIVSVTRSYDQYYFVNSLPSQLTRLYNALPWDKVAAIN